MLNDQLLDILEKIEFCDQNTGQYYRVVSVCTESTGPVAILQAID